MQRIWVALAWVASAGAPASVALAGDPAQTPRAALQRLDPQPLWREVRPEVAAFQVGFPGDPSYTQQVHSTWVGSIVEQRWAVERSDLHLEVLRYELPFLSTFVLSDASLVRRARDSLLEDRGGRKLAWEPARISERSGWTLRFEVPGPESRTEEARFLLAGRTLYILDAAPEGDGPGTLAKRFFSSFRLR
ncbi:MAG: hypothetical protein ACE5IL_05705 [Myxococcota bacterium]